MDPSLFSILERTVYYQPPAPPRKRAPDSPMQVICPGLNRSATESLQQALSILGYKNPYHGWDMLFEQPPRQAYWAGLARRKYQRGEQLTAADFDAVLGESEAVIDIPACNFMPDLVHAYPGAKVVLNYRRDVDAWYRSVQTNIVDEVVGNWKVWFGTFWTPWFYWGWMGCWNDSGREVWQRRSDQSIAEAMRQNGKKVWRDHFEYIKNVVPENKLLVWSVEDGWEPLCKFLDRPVPKEPFPRTNDAAAFSARMVECVERNDRVFKRRLAIVAVFFACVGGGVWYWRK